MATIETGTTLRNTNEPLPKKKKTENDDCSSFFSVGDRVRPKGSNGYATGTVIEIKKGVVTTKPDFRVGESTICFANANAWKSAEDDPSGNVVLETPKLISDEPTTPQKTLGDKDVAEVVVKARWHTLKVTPVDIANDIGTTEQQVDDVVKSDGYLIVIEDFFRKYKSWRTWANKPKTTITKMADRLWITEEQVTTILSKIQ